MLSFLLTHYFYFPPPPKKKNVLLLFKKKNGWTHWELHIICNRKCRQKWKTWDFGLRHFHFSATPYASSSASSYKRKRVFEKPPLSPMERGHAPQSPYSPTKRLLWLPVFSTRPPGAWRRKHLIPLKTKKAGRLSCGWRLIFISLFWYSPDLNDGSDLFLGRNRMAEISLVSGV